MPSEIKIKAYMKMARSIATLSPDKETQVGAILLSEDGRIVASSFNGFLRGAIDDDLPKTRPKKYEFIQHAERNLIYNCAYENIRTKNTTIVCTLSPCLECARAAFQSGVKSIIYEDTYHACSSLGFYEHLADVAISKTAIGKYTVLEMSPLKGGR